MYLVRLAKEVRTMTVTGMTKYFQSGISPLGSVMPEKGSILNCTTKTRINRSAKKKDGKEIPTMVNTVTSLSKILFFLTAAVIPMGIERINAKIREVK